MQRDTSTLQYSTGVLDWEDQQSATHQTTQPANQPTNKFHEAYFFKS